MPPRARTRFGTILASLIGASLLVLWAERAPGVRTGDLAGHEEPGEREPRVVLSAGRAVRPGQFVELAWAADDDIRELEILLSTDGGRHYDVCISPELDPGARHFTWRVPERTGNGLRLRIRFNRGGVEIEGPPTGPLGVDARDRESPEPLALPPVAPGRSDPGRDGRASARASLSAEDDESARNAVAPAETAGSLLAAHTSTQHAAHSRRLPGRLLSRAPRLVPLRT